MADAVLTEPIRLRPLYMERVWGGRELAALYGRALPGTAPIGESWEVVDRTAEQSVVAEGPLAGLTLHELWQTRRPEIFGDGAPDSERFPLLIKILDARDRLSIQVHPPAEIAAEMGGEPKTEMWFIAQADPDAVLYMGVKPGTDRESFARAIRGGTVEQSVHRLPVRTGDFIFVPGGRLHAIGGGLVIFEIQQNSDTTYRVFDWNRPGLDGRPRALHVAESLRCIDFTDTAPATGHATDGVLVDCPHFRVEQVELCGNEAVQWGRAGEFSVLTVVSGAVECAGRPFRAGEFLLVPACLGADRRCVHSAAGAVLLKTGFGTAPRP